MNAVRTSLLALSLLFSYAAFAQTTSADSETEGTIRVVAEPAIEAMVQEHIEINQGEGVLAGFRIQLMSSPEMSRVQNAQASFAGRYPSYSTRVVHESPNFKLRVGGFADRFKAYQALQELVVVYSGAFIVKDLVRISEL